LGINFCSISSPVINCHIRLTNGHYFCFLTGIIPAFFALIDDFRSSNPKLNQNNLQKNLHRFAPLQEIATNGAAVGATIKNNLKNFVMQSTTALFATFSHRIHHQALPILVIADFSARIFLILQSEL